MKTKIGKKYGANMDERESRSPQRFEAELPVDNTVKRQRQEPKGVAK